MGVTDEDAWFPAQADVSFVPASSSVRPRYTGPCQSAYPCRAVGVPPHQHTGDEGDVQPVRMDMANDAQGVAGKGLAVRRSRVDRMCVMG